MVGGFLGHGPESPRRHEGREGKELATRRHRRHKNRTGKVILFCGFCASLWLSFCACLPSRSGNLKNPVKIISPCLLRVFASLCPSRSAFLRSLSKRHTPIDAAWGTRRVRLDDPRKFFCHVGERDESRRFVAGKYFRGGRAGSKALARREAQPDDRRRKAHGFFVGFPRCRSAESLVRARGVTQSRNVFGGLRVASRRLRRPAPWTQSTAHRSAMSRLTETMPRLIEARSRIVG